MREGDSGQAAGARILRLVVDDLDRARRFLSRIAKRNPALSLLHRVANQTDANTDSLFDLLSVLGRKIGCALRAGASGEATE
jgi:hypothetical protein